MPIPPPTIEIKQNIDYLRDFIFHKFWDPEAEPNLEEEEDISGKIVIVTGANAGLGQETALQLAKRGAKVILACRDLQKAQKAVEYIKSKVTKAELEILKLDLADLDSIRQFVAEFGRKYDKLDILVNNAGVISTNGKLQKTSDGLEYHMGINHLGPFLFTRLLIDKLKKANGSRIVCVSSSNLVFGSLHLDDFMMEKNIRTGHRGFEPYDDSKLAHSLCMKRLASKIDPSIRLFNMCPGLVKTEIFRNESGFLASIGKFFMAVIGITPDKGCETIIYCATSKSLSDCGKGEMYRMKKLYDLGNSYLDDKDPRVDDLYEMSENYVGL